MHPVRRGARNGYLYLLLLIKDTVFLVDKRRAFYTETKNDKDLEV